MIDVVYLGESLSTLASISRKLTVDETIIVDIWSDGSLLSGIKVSNLEVDKIPMLVKESITTDNTVYFKPDTIYIGSETTYDSKVSMSVELQRNWFQELSQGGIIPRKFFCSIYRSLKSLVGVKRNYDVISTIKLRNKELKLLRYGVLHYGTLVNTLPLPYFINKTDLPSDIKEGLISKLDYVGLLINIALTRCNVDNYTVVYVGKKNLIPHTIVVIPLRYFMKELTNYAIVYSITSIRRPYISFKGEYVNRLLLDVNKLGMFNVELISYKVIHEKYGLLGRVDEDLEYYLGSLKDAGVVLKGRLGIWRELSIKELLDNNNVV
jgi:hypothetical protein